MDEDRARQGGGRFGALRELFGFAMVGGTGALAFISVSSVLIAIDTGLPDWIVSALVWAGLIVPVYLGHHRFSFRADIAHSRGLPRYAAVQAGALCIASGFSFIIYEMLHIAPPLGPILVSGLTASVTFMVLKLWAFASPSP